MFLEPAVLFFLEMVGQGVLTRGKQKRQEVTNASILTGPGDTISARHQRGS